MRNKAQEPSSYSLCEGVTAIPCMINNNKKFGPKMFISHNVLYKVANIL